MTTLFPLRPLLLALALFGASALAPALAQEGCLSDAEVQEQVSSGEILPVAQVLQREGIDPSTQVLTVRVCDSGDGPTYHLGLLGSSGEAQNRAFSAR